MQLPGIVTVFRIIILLIFVKSGLIINVWNPHFGLRKSKNKSQLNLIDLLPKQCCTKTNIVNSIYKHAHILEYTCTLTYSEYVLGLFQSYLFAYLTATVLINILFYIFLTAS